MISQEGNGVGTGQCLGDLLVDWVLIRHVSVEDERLLWSLLQWLIVQIADLSILTALKCIQWSFGGQEGRTTLDWRSLAQLLRQEARIHGLGIFTRLEFRFWNFSLKFNIIVFGCVEKLFIVGVAVFIIFRFFYVEIWLPAQLTNHISFKAHFRVVGHSGPFNFVFLVGIQLASRWVCNSSFIFERFIKIFLSTIRQCGNLPKSSFYFWRWSG